MSRLEWGGDGVMGMVRIRFMISRQGRGRPEKRMGVAKELSEADAVLDINHTAEGADGLKEKLRGGLAAS